MGKLLAILKSINWYAVAVIAFFVFIGWMAKEEADLGEEQRDRRMDWIYSKDRTWCRTYTTLADFEFHPGLRKSTTLTMENGDKFLYYCGDRYIDICNNLERGKQVCYDDMHSEVLVSHLEPGETNGESDEGST